MRKFDVSLMVVDQRPSQIDDEVMSQLATRVSGLLTDEHDIAAVLSGTGDRSALRSMLASLEPSQQCLVLGHAIPMPMIVRTREYSRRLTEQVSGNGTGNGKTPDRTLGLSLLTGGRRGGD
jgi:DNA helicase HerA-like ATPase